jgi:hypothetical protein
MRIGLSGGGSTADIWAAVFPVGADKAARAASVRRTTSFLRELVSEP